jgi:hypothetical protein
LNYSKSLICTILVFSLLSPLFSQRTKSSLHAGSQRHAERSLKDSLYFLKFIDPSVSNKGTEEEKQLFINIIKKDLISRTLYLKFAFTPSLTEIKKTQDMMIILFQKVHERDCSEAFKMLNDVAPEVTNSKNAAAKRYLSLGYRNAKNSQTVKIMADNLTETNYSIRLYEYVKAIKLAKYAKRYAIISIIEKRRILETKEKPNYNKYDITANLIDKYLTENKDYYREIHKDNFYITDDSILEKTLSNPELEKTEEFKKYQKEE